MNEKAKTVHEVAKLTGITARTLHYYDEIGLLKPSIITEAKYRQYTDDDLTRLQEILFFREVGFALKEIKELLDSPHYVRSEALERHVLILEAQKERIEALISLVKDTINGNKEIKFSAFSNAKILELQSQFQEEVLEQWGNTESFREYKTMFSSHSKQIQEKEIESFYSMARNIFEKLAMYEKLGLLNLGMKQLKQNTIFSDKLKKQLLMQFERKSKFYNLGNWDSLIGWFDETKPLEKVQEACVKENDVASGNPSTSIPEVQSKNIEPSSIQKTIPKKQNNPKSIFKTNIGVTNTVPSKVKEEQKKPTKIKNNQDPKTLYDTLDQTYKKMILNLKIKYYKDMHDEEKKQSALYKYDRLEESLSSKPSIKNFDILLLMLIGDGDGSLDIEQSIPKEYNGEYKKVLNKINSRRKH